jgi:hypothetical protein
MKSKLLKISINRHSRLFGCGSTAQIRLEGGRAPDYESGGRRFESFRARHASYYSALVFPFEATDMAVLVCSRFANFVRGEFSQLKIACSASPLVRAR